MARRGAPPTHEAEDVEDFIDENEASDFGDEDAPPVIDPYAVLGLKKDASGDEVKKAYRKKALLHHPDKSADADKTAANKKFQEIAFAYAVLSDDRRRKRYDLTGSTEEVLHDDEDFDWLSFYRKQFDDVVTEESIKRIQDEYKNSDKERTDLLAAYTQFKGNLVKIYESVMLSDILEDDDRFRDIINTAIKDREVESFKAFEKENNDAAREKAKQDERKRRQKFDQENGEDIKSTKEKMKKNAAKKKDANGLGDLAALIQQRQRARGAGFLQGLEEKYGSGRKRKAEGPSEEDFARMAERGRKAKAGAKGKPTKKGKKFIEEDSENDESDGTGSEDLESPPPKKARRGKGKA